MIDEVELDGERARAVRQRPRRQSARRDLQRNAPRMIQTRRTRQRHLAHDLHPHVQRGIGVLPLVVREGRPQVELVRGHST